MRSLTISRESHRLHDPLSAKLRDMRSRFGNVRHGGSMSVEDLDAIDHAFREMTSQAERLEDGARDADAAVPVAYDLACQAGDQIRVVTSLLAAMVGSHQADGGDQARCAFVRARLFLEKAEAVFLGKATS